MSEQVIKRAQAISLALADALAWANDSHEPDIANNYLLKKELKRSIAQCKRLERAASTKMGVGVYGASQAGKSYLVSVLARRNGNPLIAEFGDYQADFVRQINPAGGQESTGLVTRFTTHHHKTPDGFPVQVRLLLEVDLVKIFLNSYAQDIIAADDVDYEEISQRAVRVLDSIQPTASHASPVSIEDVYELEEYCNSRFSVHPNIQALKQIDFWSRAADLLPHVGFEDRVRVVELLWEGLEPVSDTYRYLTKELLRIGSPVTAFCPIEALMKDQGGELARSDRSIINVSTLDGLTSKADELIEIKTESSETFEIQTPVLCALVAELLIPLQEQPHQFFKDTDLLDFPGARSRNPRPKSWALLSQDHVKVESFLRGKVAYLFDKFSADMQLTSMLLCVGPSNQEVAGLPRLVEDWVALTHGMSPEERLRLPTSLFLVLTKFDQELTQDSGQTADGSRWTTRLEASLLKPFGANSHRTSWVSRWTPDGPFNNTYWLRNPNVDQFGLVEYEGEIAASPEVAFVKERENYLLALREEFLRNPLVGQYFQEPAKAWEAAMSLNDGGVSYLVSSLSEACHPDHKLKQIDERLSSLLEQRIGDLSKYYVSGDRGEIQREKKELANQLLKFGATLLQKQRLGEFIDFLLISDTETREIFQRIQVHYEREKSSSLDVSDTAKTQSEDSIVDDELASALGIEIDTDKKEISKLGVAREAKDDFPERFVVNFFSEWASAVLDNATASNVGGYLHVNLPLLQKLLQEIERAAYRTGLVEHLKDVTRQNSQYRSSNPKNWVLKQTAILTSIFNEFVAFGALSRAEDTGETTIESFDGRKLDVFRRRDEPTGDLQVPDIASDYGKQYSLDWLHAIQSSVRQNSDYAAAQFGDTAANRVLGKILDDLGSHKQSGLRSV